MDTKIIFFLWISIALAIGYPVDDTDEEAIWLSNKFDAFDPFRDHSGEILPKAPYTFFKLFTKSNPDSGQMLSTGDLEALSKSNFNPNNPTRITVHGWGSNIDSSMNSQLKSAYFKYSDNNMIAIDWTAVSDLFYTTAKSKSKDVGKEIAEFLEFLHKAGGLSLDQVTCIGHSLGAHVCGLIGKHLNNIKMNTIVGLDPAGPLYSMNAAQDRVNIGDASYVEIIHTSMDLLGFDKPIGDADFYPNWGKGQPGCSDIAGSCSHGRSASYYIESLNLVNHFHATECKDFDDIKYKTCNNPGEYNVKLGGEPSNHGNNLKGVFYLPTKSESPYGIGNPN